MKTVLTARIPQRELVIAAWKADMIGCTAAEVSKYAILRLGGYEHDRAKELALSSRMPVEKLDDIEKNTSVQMPAEWIEAAREKLPDVNTSTVYRFALTRLSMPDEQAMTEAMRQVGRPRKR